MGVYKNINVKRNDARIQANAARGPRKPYQAAQLTKMDIFGDEELLALFEGLRKDQQDNIIVSAYRKSSKVMLQKMQSNLLARTNARTSGNLYRSLGIMVDKRNYSEPVVFLGARRFGRWAGFHAHLVEAGTTDRVRYSSEGKTGRVKPTYFFANAVNATKDQVIDRFKYDRLKSFHDYVTRYNKKAKS